MLNKAKAIAIRPNGWTVTDYKNIEQTLATISQTGQFETADGGTLFLDKANGHLGRQVTGIATDVMGRFNRYTCPGNRRGPE